MFNNIDLSISGITAKIIDNSFVITSERELITLSSAILNGGYRKVRNIVNHQVPDDYNSPDPLKDITKVIEEIGLKSDDTIGLLTSVWVTSTRATVIKNEGLTVTSVITAGVSNASCAGISYEEKNNAGTGTINIIVLLDGNLTSEAMVNAVITATEAKVMALRDMKVLTRDGNEASGTSTDAIVIACTGSGKEFPFAGTATLPGELIGKTVREGVKRAIAKDDKEPIVKEY